MTVVAFAPKEAYRDLDTLGTVYVNDDTTVNVRQLVEESPNGTFTTDDPHIIARLDKYKALKRVSLAKANAEPEKPKPDEGGGADGGSDGAGDNAGDDGPAKPEKKTAAKPTGGSK